MLVRAWVVLSASMGCHAQGLGNYIGPGWCGGKAVAEGTQCDYSVPPINSADALARQHDIECGNSPGRVCSREADHNLVRGAADLPHGAERTLATVMANVVDLVNPIRRAAEAADGHMAHMADVARRQQYEHGHHPHHPHGHHPHGHSPHGHSPSYRSYSPHGFGGETFRGGGGGGLFQPVDFDVMQRRDVRGHGRG